MSKKLEDLAENGSNIGLISSDEDETDPRNEITSSALREFVVHLNRKVDYVQAFSDAAEKVDMNQIGEKSKVAFLKSLNWMKKNGHQHFTDSLAMWTFYTLPLAITETAIAYGLEKILPGDLTFCLTSEESRNARLMTYAYLISGLGAAPRVRDSYWGKDEIEFSKKFNSLKNVYNKTIPKIGFWKFKPRKVDNHGFYNKLFFGASNAAMRPIIYMTSGLLKTPEILSGTLLSTATMGSLGNRAKNFIDWYRDAFNVKTENGFDYSNAPQPIKYLQHNPRLKLAAAIGSTALVLAATAGYYKSYDIAKPRMEKFVESFENQDLMSESLENLTLSYDSKWAENYRSN